MQDFSGRKGTAPLVPTYGMTSSTPGHAPTLYHSNAFLTQKGKLGKENQRASQADEYLSELAVKARSGVGPGCAERRDGPESLPHEFGKSLLSANLRMHTPVKKSVLYHPSASAQKSPMIAAS